MNVVGVLLPADERGGGRPSASKVSLTGLTSGPTLVVRQPTMRRNADVLEVDPVSGRRTGLATYARRALRALKAKRVPHAVIGATALAVRGLPRMTRDLDVVVPIRKSSQACDALRGNESRVRLRLAAGEPEASVLSEAPKALVFGIRAPVATLEQLLLLYLHSNQPKHLGDFARIVTDTRIDIGAVERYLADVHPVMLSEFRDRVRQARTPKPAPPRPTRRRTPRSPRRTT